MTANAQVLPSRSPPKGSQCTALELAWCRGHGVIISYANIDIAAKVEAIYDEMACCARAAHALHSIGYLCRHEGASMLQLIDKIIVN